MNKIALSVLTLCLLMPVRADAIGAGSATFVPEVIYISPEDNSTVDLSGKPSLRFSWQQVPIPSGNRDSYRMMIIKEPNMGSIFDQKIDGRIFSVNVPAGLFEDGARYSWHVKQRDAVKMIWSRYHIRYFNVVKK